MLVRFLAPLVLAAWLTGCSSDAGRNSADEAADLRAIDRFYERWRQFYEADGGPDEYVAFYADGAVLVPPNEPPVVGREAIRSYVASIFGPFRLSLDMKPEETRVSGDWAYRRYRASGTVAPRAGGEAIPFDNKYLDVLRRVGRDEWRVHIHMWSSNIPLPSPAEAVPPQEKKRARGATCCPLGPSRSYRFSPNTTVPPQRHGAHRGTTLTLVKCLPA
jgi:ketosteroid isomerase-like protein